MEGSFLEEAALKLDPEGGLDSHVLRWKGGHAGEGNCVCKDNVSGNPGHGQRMTAIQEGRRGSKRQVRAHGVSQG